MNNQTLKTLIFVILLLHGLGHMGAMFGIVYHHRRGSTGDWLSDRSWLIPSMSADTAKVLAATLWVVAWIGFIAAALAFMGYGLPTSSWSSLAIVSALVSGVGMLLFWGSWPLPNTLAAMAINIAVLVTQFWTDWPQSVLAN